MNKKKCISLIASTSSVVSIRSHAMITHNNEKRAIESFVCRENSCYSFYISITFLKFSCHGLALDTMCMSRVVYPEKMTNKNIPFTWLIKRGHQVLSHALINRVKIIDIK